MVKYWVYTYFMKRVSVSLFLIISGSIFLLQTANAQNTLSHWEKQTTIQQLGPISETNVEYPQYCDLKPTQKTQVTTVDEPDFRSISEKLKETYAEPVPDTCHVSNAQGKFGLKCLDSFRIERCEARHYQPQGYGDEFMGWSQSLGVTKWYDPAPSGVNVLYLSRSSPYDYGYRVAVDKTVRDWGEPKIDGSDVEWGAGKDYATKRNLVDFKYSDGQLATVQRHSFSDNGRFLLGLASEGLYKVDLSTLERTLVLRDTTDRPLYFAISNDGNFVASVNIKREIQVIDARNCEVIEAKHSWQKTHTQKGLYAGCKIETNLHAQMQQQGLFTYNNVVRRLYFSPGGDKLFFSMKTDDDPTNSNYTTDYTWKEFVVTAEEWEPSSEGYLAMGDSYSSGEGDTEGGTWYEPGTDEQGDKATFAGRNLCHLSRRSYPYLIATDLGYLSTNAETPPEDGLFHSVACSGAKIHNIIGIIGEKHDDAGASDFAITDNQYRFRRQAKLDNWQPGVTRQLNSLTGEFLLEELKRDFEPEVITLGIGGNDAGFGDFLMACLLPGTCDYANEESDKAKRLYQMILQTKERLVKTYRQTKVAAPEARVYAHGYPVFVRSEGGSCAVNVGLDEQERKTATDAVLYMNQIVKAAAGEAGVFYVDVENILEGGRLCDEGPTKYFNGVTAGNDVDPGEGAEVFGFYLQEGLCMFNCVGAETFHPNPEGFKKYKKAIIDQTNGLTATTNKTEEQTGLPLFSDNLKNNGLNESATTDAQTKYSSGKLDIKPDGENSVVTVAGLYPGSQAEVVVHSTPTSLGNFTVDDSGVLRASFRLPETLEDGYHELHVLGIDSFGAKVDYYQPFVLNPNYPQPEEEVAQSCSATDSTGVDSDKDGIDDGCDGKVAQQSGESPQTSSATDVVQNEQPGDDTPVTDNQEQNISQRVAQTTESMERGESVLGSSSTLENQPKNLSQLPSTNNKSPGPVWWIVAAAGIMITITTYFGITKKENP